MNEQSDVHTFEFAESSPSIPLPVASIVSLDISLVL